MALKQVKNKIIATKKTGQVTKAMESVSAVKMRKAQERAFAGRPYVHAAMRILAQLSGSQDGLSHPFTKKRDSSKRTLVIVVTSDKGLAGSVNSAVLKQLTDLRIEHVTQTFDMIAFGRKAVEYAGREGMQLVANYTNVSDDVVFADIDAITKQIVQSFRDGTYDRVEVIYQNFVSTFEQAPTYRKILPLDPAQIAEIMEGIKPKHGKFSDYQADDEHTIAYTIEPSAQEVLDALIPSLVQIMLYHALLESKASEHSARMVAMKNATDKSKEVIKSLTIQYNKARQAAITAEVSEITAGVEAMK